MLIRNISRIHCWSSRIFSSRRFLAVRYEDDVYQTINMLAKDLSRLDVNYAIIGGNALKVHGYSRSTMDVDVLVAKGGKKIFADNLVGSGYIPRVANTNSNFMNTVFHTPIDLVETGEYPGDGKPQKISFPDPTECSFGVVVNPYGNEVKYLTLFSLVQLKLAAYQALPNRRIKDKLDVIELIKVAHLSKEYDVTKLDCSVRETFVQCCQQALEEAKDFK